VKEQALNDYGLTEIYEAIVMNPSSGCAHWHFVNYAIEKNVFPDELKNYQGSYDESSHILSLRIGEAIEKIFAEKGKEGIKDYLLALEKMMKQSTMGKEEDSVLNDLENYNRKFNVFDDYDYNRHSYEKYGGAYGYDDDTIDSAFEGDPENYWNID
jgi:hypothetical protein